MKKRYLLITTIVSLITINSAPTSALDEIQVGRYVTQKTDANNIQLNPLSEVTSFNPRSQKVGKAVRELLLGTGYSLYEKTPLPGFDYMPLPRVHKHFHNMQVIEILRALVGPNYQIIIIEPLRQVTFCFSTTCTTYASTADSR